MTARTEIVVLPDAAAFIEAAAERIAKICERSVGARGACAVALTGGETPRPVYARLAQDPYRGRIPWDRLQIFWGDERCVPPDDPRSNFRMTQETLLAKVPVPPASIHRMSCDSAERDAGADSYAQALRAHVPAHGGWPRFDLVLLGIGADAHTASLFPGEPQAVEGNLMVVVYRPKAAAMWRMSLTVPVLTNAAEVLFLATGASKAEAVQQAVEGPVRGAVVPSALIRPAGGRVTWLLDRDAASRLDRARDA